MTNRATRRQMIALGTIVLALAGFQEGQTWLQPVNVQAQGRTGANDAFALVGIAPGQFLRINLGTVPPSLGMDLAWTYRVTDTAGQTLFHSTPISVPSGEWRSSDLSHKDLNIVGDSVTGRVQLMIWINVQASRRVHLGNVVGSLEVVDQTTGATVNGYFVADSFSFGVERCMKDC